MKQFNPNEGAQKDFIRATARLNAYIGGLGSGKTWALCVRALQKSQQPVPPGRNAGPRVLLGAINYPVLKDVVLPQFLEVMEGTNLWKTGRQDTSYMRSDKKALLKANCGCKDKVKCPHRSEVLFRSLENPDVIRGIELAHFGIDEGRHLSRYAFDVANGRLRQPGYAHTGDVASTPNGYDWMWAVFHPDSPKRYDDTEWFNASTYDNRHHVGEAYIRSLEATYEGKFFEQEVLGHFVGIVAGAVFPHWDSNRHLQTVEYDPELPLVSMWDFGVGDPGVCLFANIDWRVKELPSGGTEEQPVLKFLGYLEATDWDSKAWAKAFREFTGDTYGRRPDRNVGDPAGRQRNSATGTSTLDAMAAEGVHISPAPKRPLDYGILVLDNMMAGDRVLADARLCSRLGAAFSTHKWPLDQNGQRTGNKPVHDWTSHFCDAARYGAMSFLSHYPRRIAGPETATFEPGTLGYTMEQMLHPGDPEWLGAPSHKRRPELILRGPIGA